MVQQANRGRLLISCQDRPGIVAEVTQFLLECGAHIRRLDQHSTEPANAMLLMRLELDIEDLESRGPALEQDFQRVAAAFAMDWRLTCVARLKRLVVFVSSDDHALLELLWRQRRGDLPVQILAVISDCPDLRATVTSWNLPYHHVPFWPGQEAAAEDQQLRIIREYQADTLVLAGYGRILGPALLATCPRSVMSVRHGFLSRFVDRRGYAAAVEGGVKLVGATAHYVTEDVDAGPIIDQDVQRVKHGCTVNDLRALGRSLEAAVLMRAIAWHAEDRILIYGNKTIVFE